MKYGKVLLIVFGAILIALKGYGFGEGTIDPRSHPEPSPPPGYNDWNKISTMGDLKAETGLYQFEIIVKDNILYDIHGYQVKYDQLTKTWEHYSPDPKNHPDDIEWHYVKKSSIVEIKDRNDLGDAIVTKYTIINDAGVKSNSVVEVAFDKDDRIRWQKTTTTDAEGNVTVEIRDNMQYYRDYEENTGLLMSVDIQTTVTNKDGKVIAQNTETRSNMGYKYGYLTSFHSHIEAQVGQGAGTWQDQDVSIAYYLDGTQGKVTTSNTTTGKTSAGETDKSSVLPQGSRGGSGGHLIESDGGATLGDSGLSLRRRGSGGGVNETAQAAAERAEHCQDMIEFHTAMMTKSEEGSEEYESHRHWVELMTRDYNTAMSRYYDALGAEEPARYYSRAAYEQSMSIGYEVNLKSANEIRSKINDLNSLLANETDESKISQIQRQIDLFKERLARIKQAMEMQKARIPE